MGAKEWLEICWEDYDVELKTDDDAYKKMANAIKNAKYQRSSKQDPAQKEVQAAVKAVRG